MAVLSEMGLERLNRPAVGLIYALDEMLHDHGFTCIGLIGLVSWELSFF
jgi:hypothetical protein